MGGRNSIFLKVQGISNEPVYLPIPETYGALKNPDTLQTSKRKRNHDETDALQHAYVEFVNNPHQFHYMFMKSAGNFEKYARKCWEHFKPLIGSEALLFHIKFNGDDCTTPDTLAQVRSIITQARAEKRSETVLVAITLFQKGEGGHANTGVIKYDPDTDTATQIVFEPHAKRDSIEWVALSIIQPEAGLEVDSISPFSHMGLQHQSSNLCVQWSVIMLMSYMINCTAMECDERKLENQLVYLSRNQNFVMPTFLFYMAASLYDYKLPKTPVRFGFDYPEIKYDTEMDAHQCAISVECQEYPCARHPRTGVCFNTNLFGDAIPVLKDAEQYSTDMNLYLKYQGGPKAVVLKLLKKIAQFQTGGQPVLPGILSRILKMFSRANIVGDLSKLNIVKLFVGTYTPGMERPDLKQMVGLLKKYNINFNTLIGEMLREGMRIHPDVFLELGTELDKSIRRRYTRNVSIRDTKFPLGSVLYNQLQEYHAEKVTGVPRFLNETLTYIVRNFKLKDVPE